MTASFLYVTAGSEEEALAIGRALVEDRLASCANVLPGTTAVYWWEGAVQDDREAVLIVKTRLDLMEELTDRVCKLHSYDLPCVVGLPLSEGNPEYLAWVRAETKPN